MTQNNNLKFNIHRQAGVYGPTDLVFTISNDVSHFHDNFIHVRVETNTKINQLDFNSMVINDIKSIVDKHGLRLVRRSTGHFVINNFFMKKDYAGNEFPFVVVTNVDLKDDAENYDLTDARSFLEIFGDGEIVEKLKVKLSKYIANNKNKSTISWHYFLPDGKTTIKTINVESPNAIHKEFYPWLPKDPESYFKDFMDSDNNILVLLGPPGTGKTSFLRHMLVKYNINAIVTYDADIYSSDKFFIDFLADNKSSMLIIEDADTLLLDRENNHNKNMSKILNASDGLIKLPNKKMIFTANLADDTQIDQALTRPGRCYDVLHFREFDFTEACEAARVANITLPNEDRKYTLSELFNNHNRHNRKVKAERKFGFV